MPSKPELSATAVLALPLDEVSAKVRTGNTEVQLPTHVWTPQPVELCSAEPAQLMDM